MKKQLWKLFKFVYFFNFELLANNTIKNETGGKNQKFICINLIKHSPESLAHVKKHLCHIGSPTNVQNNCIKSSGFCVDITRLFRHREQREKNCAEKSSSTRKFVGRFLGPTPHTSSIICRFIPGKIKLVTKFSPNIPKFTDKIVSGC